MHRDTRPKESLWLFICINVPAFVFGICKSNEEDGRGLRLSCPLKARPLPQCMEGNSNTIGALIYNTYLVAWQKAARDCGFSNMTQRRPLSKELPWSKNFQLGGHLCFHTQAFIVGRLIQVPQFVAPDLTETYASVLDGSLIQRFDVCPQSPGL